jgi:histidinol-phosphate aminotransferase
MVERCGKDEQDFAAVTLLARQCVLARKEYVPGKPVEEVRRELGITDIIKMASNENPLGTSPMALKAMIEEIKQRVHRYPQSLCHDLTAKLAGVHDLKPEVRSASNAAYSGEGVVFELPGDSPIVKEGDE